NMEMHNAAMEAITEAKEGTQGEYYGYESAGETDSFNESRVYSWARTRPSRRQPWKAQQNFSNWIVFVSRPTSSAYVGVRKLNNYIFYVTIASTCIVIFVAWWAAQRIATPILRVAEAARSIGQGEFDSEIVVDSDDEVGTLAEEFNVMRRNLKTAVDQLTQEERKLTTIVDNLGEGLVVVEPTGYVLYVNPVAERLLNLGDTSGFNYITLDTEAGEIRWTNASGETGAEEITDTRTADLKILSASQREATRHRTMIAEISVEGELPENSKHRILRIIASHFPDESGNVAGTVYVFDDITDEHEIEQMKSEFVSLVSHELRTPLTSIKGFISLILDGKTGVINEKQHESLSRALRQSERLAELINDLLDISRIEAGRIEMKQEQIQIDAIAERRIEELRPQADEKVISLLLETTSVLPAMVGDADRIGQVFINLIGNAIKYTPDNGNVTVRISMDSRNGNSESNGFHVEVIDTGPGIPVEEREKVFDKFTQLGSVQTRQQGGSGLGLSIASGIVEAHGGKLWVDTGDNGQGSNFQFFIPIEGKA
ncbi:HAMP domain-containing protein, partial [Candidatus Poribacteria bacterium]|nr:HAMP domain-containing protein [Candidatus Poribacteria bacterium]